MRRLLALSLASLAVLVAAGWALIASDADAGAVKKVNVGSNFFAPGSASVKAGGKVRFAWEGGTFEVHDVNVRKGPAKFKSPLQAGGTWTTKRLTKPGKYLLFCSQHPEEMTMTLTVKKR
jgi:plastocyanin